MLLHMLVEGRVDEAVSRRLICEAGHESGQAYGRKGWTYIKANLAAFNSSCGKHGLLTLVDFMDTGLDCPATVVKEWLPHCERRHIFRVVVREIESWILADRAGLAAFLHVPLVKLPLEPEAQRDPKQVLINLARGSKAKAIRAALVPADGQSASEGPLYSSELERFIREQWDPAAARVNSASLDRCLARLVEIS